jgi:thioredoxin-dependent peroxiredoxin
MADITFKDSTVSSVGELPEVGAQAPDFELVGSDLSPIRLSDFTGSKVVLSIFPSIDTGVCANSVRTFNEKAAALDGAKVINVSKDLPFAQARFCGAEGIDNVVVASAFRSSFGDDYGVTFADGPLEGLLSRSVVVIDERGKVVYTEQVPVTGHEPDYDEALAAL